jgi:hypothetical protein
MSGRREFDPGGCVAEPLRFGIAAAIAFRYVYSATRPITLGARTSNLETGVYLTTGVDRDRDDPIAVSCGRCGKVLNMRVEDLKDRRTIDCEACEYNRPIENPLPVTQSSGPLQSAQVESRNGRRIH